MPSNQTLHLTGAALLVLLGIKDGADRFYNKIGLYRDRWQEPMTMYVDNYVLGDSFEAVDPSSFDRRP